MNWAEFIPLGQYGFYVWSAYLLAVVILWINVVLPLRRRKIVQRQLREYHRLERGPR